MKYRILLAALLTTIAASVSGCATDGETGGAAKCIAPNICLAVRLDGKGEYSATGSAATGIAFIAIDVAAKRVTLSANIDGIALADLADNLVAAPIGPVHIHQYADDSVSALALTFPYGAQYSERPNGFALNAVDVDFTERSKLADPAMSFDAFVAAATANKLVLNIHTDKFNAGEISGVLASPSNRK